MKKIYYKKVREVSFKNFMIWYDGLKNVNFITGELSECIVCKFKE